MPLEGGTNNLLTYPAISAGEQQIRIYWPGDQTYAPTTIEATVTVNDREQIQFTLNEGPYEVGMKFTADQGYDYEATAQAIYDAVVASNSLNIPYDQMTVEYNTDPTGTFDLFEVRHRHLGDPHLLAREPAVPGQLRHCECDHY